MRIPDTCDPAGPKLAGLPIERLILLGAATALGRAPLSDTWRRRALGPSLNAKGSRQ
jgi:hypothetical protein